jgi:hypothetical protein
MNPPRKRNAGTAPGGFGEATTRNANNTAPTPAPQPCGFVVIQQKETREVEVGRYADEATALSVVRLLAWAGAVARVERA